MAQIKKIKVDSEKIQTAIRASIPLTISTYTLPIEMEEYIVDVLKEFLIQLNQQHLFDSLSYCVKELVINAKKANTKRVYFKLKNLDITNDDDYKVGMETFKQDTLNNIRYYLEEQRKNGLYIKVLFQMRNNKIKVEIKNKAELTVNEYMRIHDKITRAQQFDSIEEGVVQLLDESEGAGLGLVIMILLLRRIGLTEENYQVLSENGETITRIIIPFTQKFTNDLSEVSSKFVDLIEGLPEFPENITAVNRLISDPNSKMSDIAMKISNDVSLTGELLKMVNSAAYSLATPCQSIGDAVKIVGLRGIKNLLFSIGSMKSLVADSSESNKKLWDHSYKVGFFAYNLARNFCRGSDERGFIDDSYVCGILHDMGKILFANAHPDVLEKIKNLCIQRGIPASLFEGLIAGVNHGAVGALIAEKWNFPDVLVNIIRYHHTPEDAPENIRKLASIIYLSDLIAHYGEGTVDYEQISDDVLKMFDISSEEQFEGIAERLLTSFEKNKK